MLPRETSDDFEEHYPLRLLIYVCLPEFTKPQILVLGNGCSHHGLSSTTPLKAIIKPRIILVVISVTIFVREIFTSGWKVHVCTNSCSAACWSASFVRLPFSFCLHVNRHVFISKWLPLMYSPYIHVYSCRKDPHTRNEQLLNLVKFM